MRSVSLSELREEVRTRYDLPTFTTTTFVTTTLVNSLINKSLQSFYALLMQCYGDNYFAASEELTTSANVPLTSLPTRFSKLIALHWLRATGDVVKIKPASVDHIRHYGLDPVSWSEYGPRYRLSGVSAIEWFPTPNAAYDVRCDYVAIPDDLGEEDAFDAGPGWEEWVVLDVCRKIASREEKDPSVWLAERADIEQRIRSQAPERDEGESLVLRDVTGMALGAWELRNRLTNGDW